MADPPRRSWGAAAGGVPAALVALFVLVVLVTVGAPRAIAAPGALGGRCVMMAGAGRAACRTVVRAPSRAGGAGSGDLVAPAPTRDGFAYVDFAAAYSLYRLVSATDPQRRCRLQPTCSLFAARAARRFGLLRGLLMGLARAQMAHSDQGGLLPRAVASDGRFIFLDPVERWAHGDP